MNNQDFQRFAEPIDEFAFELSNGAEIYKGETYWEFPDGETVLDDKDSLLEYLSDHWDDVLDHIADYAERKVAE